jgi:hypothetical protein
VNKSQLREKKNHFNFTSSAMRDNIAHGSWLAQSLGRRSSSFFIAVGPYSYRRSSIISPLFLTAPEGCTVSQGKSFAGQTLEHDEAGTAPHKARIFLRKVGR